MSVAPAPPGLEELLKSLEQVIAQLAEGTAPLEDLVAAHQRAIRLLADAQSRLDDLKTRAAQLTEALAE
ncbi:MAG: exodeoxyribonuclease VII small subunit [Candidatus Dormiibacterota bacterium]